jgi:alpha-amylase
VTIQKFERRPGTTTQDYEGAADLDIKPASAGQAVQVCRVFADANTDLSIRFKADATGWTPQTSIKLIANAEDGTQIGSHVFDQKTNGSSFSVHVAKKQFYSFVVEGANTPQPNTSYQLRVTYTAPQSL